VKFVILQAKMQRNIYASWFDQQYKLTWKDLIETKIISLCSVSCTLFNNLLSFL